MDNILRGLHRSIEDSNTNIAPYSGACGARAMDIVAEPHRNRIEAYIECATGTHTERETTPLSHLNLL